MSAPMQKLQPGDTGAHSGPTGRGVAMSGVRARVNHARRHDMIVQAAAALHELDRAARMGTDAELEVADREARRLVSILAGVLL